MSECTLTLLSDALVRDDLGQHTLDLLPALRRCLRTEDGVEPEIDILDVFRRANFLGGFNRKWNLPLPQVAAIAAGSVFKLKLTAPEAFARLLELQETGIGERRAEGFGRVAVNLHTVGTFDYSKLPRETPISDGAVALSSAERKQAEQILQRLLRRDLEVKLVDAVNKINIHSDLPNSQLSRWRAIARSALAQTDLKRLADFHAAEEKKASVAWERMRRARVEKVSDAGRGQVPRLTDWISDLLVGKDQLKAAFGGGLPERKLGDLTVLVTETLEKEYRIRLLDAVLSRKAKQQARQRTKQRRSL
jgi:CRISPR-associated protein Csx10